MTVTKVTCGYWMILKILLFSLLILFSSCLNFDGQLTVRDNAYDLILHYEVPGYLGYSSFTIGESLPFYLPLSLEDWQLWQDTLGNAETDPDSFVIDDSTGTLIIDISLSSLDELTLETLLPLEIERGENSLTLNFPAIPEWSDLSSIYPLNESDRFQMTILPEALLTSFSGAEYDEGENRLLLNIPTGDFIEKTEDLTLSMEW